MTVRLARSPSPRQLLVVTALFLLSTCAPAPNTTTSPQEPRLPTESDLSGDPSLARQWANRLTSDDPRARAAAGAQLTEQGERSLPLLRRFLHDRNESLRLAAFDIVYRIGPEAIPLLAEMLRHNRVTNRRHAADLLIDLAPDTEPVQEALRAALKDSDAPVARDAARALGALADKAAPSVPALVEALGHGDAHLRLYAAEALASIGPGGAAAVNDLAQLLRDPVPGVRWAACEGLASIGPLAGPAVPRLAEALKDESLYVRICAAGALGSIGPDAKAAIGPLTEAAKDPALRAEADWALKRIAGIEAAAPPQVAASEPPLIEPAPAPAAPAANPPLDWDTETGRNILWTADLGDDTFGRPVISGGVAYIGTDNARPRNPAFREECGVLMAFRASDGAFLWQDLAPRAQRDMREFLLPSTTSAPYVDGNRLYYVTAECQLRCLDTRGFRDGVNEGPYKDEPFQDDRSADIVWELDLCARLGVFPHEACSSEVLPVGGLLMVCTSNGRNEGHTRVPSPRAPSLIAVDRHSGEVVWRAAGPGEHILHGQWSSPAAASVNGRTQVLFGGGDGWLRAYDAPSGRELWRFDGNPKDAKWRPRPGVLTRSGIIASPFYDDGRVFVAMGEDPSHGDGPSLIHAVSPNGHGDVTDSRRLWTCPQVGRVVGTPLVSDGLLYVGDLGGTVYCLDARSGEVVWKHETDGAIWGCLVLAGGRLYVGNVGGTVSVLRAGRRKELLAEVAMTAPLYSRPALGGDRLYVATARTLYLIGAKP